jgi:hypothetical protein
MAKARDTSTSIDAMLGDSNVSRELRRVLDIKRNREQEHTARRKMNEADELAWDTKVAERLPKALQGLENLLALVQSVRVARLLEEDLSEKRPTMSFFEAKRVQKEEPSFQKDVEVGVKVNLHPYSLALYAGDIYEKFFEYRYDLSYNAVRDECSVYERKGTGHKIGYKYSHSEEVVKFLKHIGSPHAFNLRNLSSEDEWNPDHVLFQFFVDCSDIRKLKKYLLQCLKRL